MEMPELEFGSELELESRVATEGELLGRVEGVEELALSSSALTLAGTAGNSKPPRISSRRRLSVPARLVNSCTPPQTDFMYKHYIRSPPK